jgi:hypothetical protein
MADSDQVFNEAHFQAYKGIKQQGMWGLNILSFSSSQVNRDAQYYIS